MAKRKKYTAADHKRWAAYYAKFGAAKTQERFNLASSVLYNGLRLNGTLPDGKMFKGKPKTWTSQRPYKLGDKVVYEVTSVGASPIAKVKHRPSMEAIALLRKACKLIDEEHSKGPVQRSMTSSDAYVRLALDALEGR